jgi:chromosome segregation ATPase
LEVLVEEQTQHIENKNKRLLMLEDGERSRESEMSNLEAQLRRTSQQADEQKKKLLQAEVKIRQLTQATLKDLKAKVKEKDAEIEVLKEMVKSSNLQNQAKDKDLDRLKKRL